MKKCRRSNASPREEDVDRISNLPDPILHLILSGLESTEEAIRTSILSKRWRYLWTSAPSLDMDCSKPLKLPNEFKNIVDQVLVKRAGSNLDLDSFRLCCSDYYRSSTIWLWVHDVVILKVKKIYLKFRRYPEGAREVIELPHRLVTSNSLQELRLFMSLQFLRLPKVLGFPALRVLELNQIRLLNHNIIENFLKNCPLLEDLSIIDCFIHLLEYLCVSCSGLKKLRIDNWMLPDCKYMIGRVSESYNDEGLCGALTVVSPKLVYFEYVGHIAKRFSFDDVQSLKKAVIHPRDMLKKDGVKYLGNTICDLFAGVSHVESLSVNHYFVQCMDAKKDYSASLPNLKTLELTIDGFTVNVVIRFLKWSPNLESLHLIFLERFIPHEFKTLVQELDDVETRRKFTHHLKTVEFLEFYGEKKKMAVARLLLKHGSALEKMVFSWRNSVINHKRTIEIMNEVSKFDKASPSVRLIDIFPRPVKQATCESTK